jgi:asparagine synthase (glutamine-hydrolysing)
MCGILASFNTSYSPEELQKALMLMEHRGPDNQTGVMLDQHYLGHVRLSIIDLNERSNQPFVSDDFHMVYNGEVYNYKELIQEHQLQVKTASDTEVVLEMYKKYGEGCLQYFNGMFAIVIYNRNNNDIFIARDRLGIKPIYYRENGTSIDFSSEIAPLLSLKESKIDEFGIRQYRKLRMTIKGHTCYQDIQFFPPGHYFKNGKFHKYWELDITAKPAPSDDDLEELIGNAVSLRSRSDVPIGSYLSGGLDSTILTYLLKPTHTWTVGFEDLNEFEWGAMANKDLNSDHHQILVDKQTFLQTAEFMAEKRREPLSVPNEVLIYLMTKKVKEKNTVVLSGEGADELFWGYDRIFKWANSIDNIQLKEFDEKYCYGSNEDNEVLDFALEGIPGKTPLDKIGYYFQTVHLSGLLRRVDNSTMLCSVEARVPFVDHRLVEMMAGTPFDWRMGDSFKEPLKRIYEKLIPHEIIYRKKIGFPVPLNDIFKEEKKPEVMPMDAWLLFNLKNFQK